MVRAHLRRRQRRAVLQPGDLGLSGAAVETPGVLQQHLLQRPGESSASTKATRSHPDCSNEQSEL